MEALGQLTAATMVSPSWADLVASVSRLGIRFR